MATLAPLLLSLAPLVPLAPATGPASQDGAAPDDAVVRVDERRFAAEELEDWLLQERGEVLAPFHARYVVARRAAAAADLHLPAVAVREAVEAEVHERLEGAFGGDRARWAAELAQAGRSPAGRMAERAIRLGGTATGEHGIGFGKMGHMRAEHGAAWDVMGQIKASLDPGNIMNPGKVVPQR